MAARATAATANKATELGTVLNPARWRSRTRASPEDTFQETFVRAWRKLNHPHLISAAAIGNTYTTGIGGGLAQRLHQQPVQPYHSRSWENGEGAKQKTRHRRADRDPTEPSGKQSNQQAREHAGESCMVSTHTPDTWSRQFGP